jgi:hypothetical protein
MLKKNKTNALFKIIIIITMLEKERKLIVVV